MNGGYNETVELLSRDVSDYKLRVMCPSKVKFGRSDHGNIFGYKKVVFIIRKEIPNVALPSAMTWKCKDY